MSKIRLLALVLAATFTGTALAQPVIEPGFLHVFRRSGGVGEECFQAFLTASGEMRIDVTSVDPDGADARLDFFSGEARLRHATATSLAVDVHSAGDAEVCVRVQDPRRVLPEYKLRVAFTAVAESKDGDPAEEEIDPDPKDGDPAEEEIDPDPVVLLPDDNACRFPRSDDHGDVRSCATPLEIGTPLRGTSIHGELANCWGDDEDTFVFVVGPAERPTVAVTVEAEKPVPGVAWFGEILDANGNRLAFDAGDSDAGVRLVKTLTGPSVYYVRVHGGVQRTSGAYRLTLIEIDRHCPLGRNEGGSD